MEIGAGDLDPSLDGSYGFMYSRNMPEHIPDLDGVLQGMASVLARGGSAVHPCPDRFRTLGTELRHPAHPVLPAGDSVLFVRSIASGRLGEELNFRQDR